MQTIVVASASRPYVDFVTELLGDEGFCALGCFDGRTALDTIQRVQPAIVLMDLWLEHPRAGEMVLAFMHHDRSTRHIPVIICADHQRSVEHMRPLLDDNRCSILIKPFNVDDLLSRVADMVNTARGIQIV